MNLTKALVAHFLAIESGALVVCIGLMLADMGPALVDFPEGVAIWAIAQFLILPIALFTMPVGALARNILGMVFEEPKPTALVAGSAIGVVAGLAIALPNSDDVKTVLVALLISGSAGAVGGWVWWRFERPVLQNSMSTPSAN